MFRRMRANEKLDRPTDQPDGFTDRVTKRDDVPEALAPPGYPCSSFPALIGKLSGEEAGQYA
jgi:hypothetical protein